MNLAFQTIMWFANSIRSSQHSPLDSQKKREQRSKPCLLMKKGIFVVTNVCHNPFLENPYQPTI
jgi:hypothetical protein